MAIDTALAWTLMTGAVHLVSSAVGSTIAWFRIPSTPPPTMEDTLRALQSVRQAVADREQELQGKMVEHRNSAQEYADRGQMREARLQIRLRLLYDSQVQNVQRTLTAIESHLCAVQSAELNRSVVMALHDSSRALGRRGYDDDAVDSMLEKLDEQHEQTRDILDMINSPTLDAASLDEADIDAELQSMVGTKPPTFPQKPAQPTSIKLPIVPTTPLPVKVSASLVES